MNTAAMEFDELLDDRKTQPGPSALVSSGGLCFIESLPDAFNIMGGDADARIAYGELHPLIDLYDL